MEQSAGIVPPRRRAHPHHPDGEAVGSISPGGEPRHDLLDALLHLRLMEHPELTFVGRERRRHGPVPGGIAGLLEDPIDDVFLAPGTGLPDPGGNVVDGKCLPRLGRKLGHRPGRAGPEQHRHETCGPRRDTKKAAGKRHRTVPGGAIRSRPAETARAPEILPIGGRVGGPTRPQQAESAFEPARGPALAIASVRPAGRR